MWQLGSTPGPHWGGPDHSNIMEIMLMLVPLGEIKTERTEESNIKQVMTDRAHTVIIRESVLQNYNIT